MTPLLFDLAFTSMQTFKLRVVQRNGYMEVPVPGMTDCVWFFEGQGFELEVGASHEPVMQPLRAKLTRFGQTESQHMDAYAIFEDDVGRQGVIQLTGSAKWCALDPKDTFNMGAFKPLRLLDFNLSGYPSTRFVNGWRERTWCEKVTLWWRRLIQLES